jgi:hypothetical protein
MKVFNPQQEEEVVCHNFNKEGKEGRIVTKKSKSKKNLLLKSMKTLFQD